jgi:hypothetical protein
MSEYRKTLVKKTLEFYSPERIPRQIWILPWAEDKYPEFTSRLRTSFPDDIVQAPVSYSKPLVISGDKYKLGYYIDEWGCEFKNIHEGLIGVVQNPLISDLMHYENLKPPSTILDLNVEEITKYCRSTDQFVIAGNFQRPFERFQFVRTMEKAFVDLVTEPPGLKELLSIIHQHYCKEVESWALTPVDAIYLMDDWGTQKGTITSPDIFRKYFKPMYKEYVEIAKQHNKYVFMHSDGAIDEIIEDLIEIGIDALNSQLFCMNIEELSKKFSGKLTFWGEIDRQHMLSEGSQKEIKNAVHLIHDLFYRKGGVIAQSEFGPGAKPENVWKVFETWNNIKSK